MFMAELPKEFDVKLELQLFLDICIFVTDNPCFTIRFVETFMHSRIFVFVFSKLFPFGLQVLTSFCTLLRSFIFTSISRLFSKFISISTILVSRSWFQEVISIWNSSVLRAKSVKSFLVTVRFDLNLSICEVASVTALKAGSVFVSSSDAILFSSRTSCCADFAYKR